TIECNESTDPSHTGYATAVDNCDASPVLTYSDYSNKGTITRTWTATDACGNSSQCQQTITINDTTDPVITCPANIAISCDASIDPSNTGWATATDNCDQNPTITYTDSETAGSCPQEKTITRTWKAADDAGNFVECQQIITVEDNVSPQITCPPAYVFECNESTDPGVTGYPGVSDNCDPSPIVSYTDSLSGTTIVRKWTATDHCGNSVTCLQTITPAPNEPPVATCPGDTTIFLCSLTETALAGFFYSDPDDNLATIDLEGGNLDGNVAHFTPVEGVNVLTLIVQDECGEVDSCKTIVTVILNSPPSAGDDYSTSMFQCNNNQICLTGFSCSDIDGNLTDCYAVGGILTGGSVCFTPSNGINTVKIIAVDACGAADTALITVNVTINSAPVTTCPGFTTQNQFELPAEICVSGFNCYDADGNLTICTAAVTGDEGTIASTFDGGTVCFTADAMGMYSIMLSATDECGATSTCVTEVFVKKVSNCPIVRIEKTHNTYQGYYENVSITIENSSYDFEAFDFLIAYDASALSPVEVVKGQWLTNCDWEYFTYRFGVNGNCGTACPSGLLRIIAIAEMNDGANHPSCYGPPDGAEYELAIMRFLVTNDRTFECQYVPISFFWTDCGDNSISGMDGEILYIDNIVYDFTGNVIWDEEDDLIYPEGERIPYIGAPDLCLNPDPLKPTAVRCVEFVFGGVDIICSDSIDAPGDINLNGVANEIADAVVFTNYFIYGLQAFNVNVEGQKAATDVNKDGVILTVSDLVYLVRIICGDALPIPKIAPHVEAQFSVTNGVLNVDNPLGAAHIIIKGDAAVEIGQGASHMEMAYHFDGRNTNVLIYSLTPDNSFSGDILVTDGEIVSIDAADYDGNACTVKLVPNAFSLTGYPNPFNPVTNIGMNLPTVTDWTIEIYNVMGRKVAEFSGRNESGLVTIQWDASDQASGVYFFKAEAGKYTASRKMLLLK
ncbi:MAG: T9SS type A sorting domain-containing protein, partial [Candidatus Zixiibacteriota bacterium]